MAPHPFVMMERAIERRTPATQCCCCCCACPLSKGIYWACGILMVEAVVQLALSFLRPPWQWTLTPFIVACFVVQDLTRLALLGMASVALLKLRRGRSVLRILRLLLRGLLWLCVLEFAEMLVALVEGHLICDAPLLQQLRSQHDPSVADQPVLCELGSGLYVVLRCFVTLAVLLYCAWIVHSLVRALLDSSLGSRGGGHPPRLALRISSLGKFMPNSANANANANGKPGSAQAVVDGEIDLMATAAPASSAAAATAIAVCACVVDDNDSGGNTDHGARACACACAAAPPSSGVPPAVGARVRHPRHGGGTVTTHEAGGGVRVKFDAGSSHIYRPHSLWKLRPLDEDWGAVSAGGGKAARRLTRIAAAAARGGSNKSSGGRARSGGGRESSTGQAPPSGSAEGSDQSVHETKWARWRARDGLLPNVRDCPTTQRRPGC